MHRHQAGAVAAGDVRVQHRDRLGLPAQFQVALVADHQHPVLARPRHGAPQLGDAQHPAGRVGRRVQPEQLQPGRVQLPRVLVDHVVGPGQPGADLVGRIGQPRIGHPVTRAQAQLRRQRGDQFLRADQRQHVPVRQPGGAQPPLGPADQGVPQRRGPPHGGVAGAVGGSGQRVLDGPGHRVDRRADGQVHDPVGVPGGGGLVRFQPVPGEHRQSFGNAARRPSGEGQRGSAVVRVAHSGAISGSAAEGPRSASGPSR